MDGARGEAQRGARWVRGGSDALLVPDAAPSLPAADRELRLRDAFNPVEDGTVD